MWQPGKNNFQIHNEPPVDYPAGGRFDRSMVWAMRGDCSDGHAEHAARLLGTGPRAIYQLVESGGLHFTEIDSGGLLVCINSLPQT